MKRKSYKLNAKKVFVRLRSQRGVGIELAISLALILFALVGMLLTLVTVFHSRIVRQQQRVTDRLDLERIFEEFRDDPDIFDPDVYVGYDVVVGNPDENGDFYFLVFQKGEVVLKVGMTKKIAAGEEPDGTPSDMKVISWRYDGDEIDRLGEDFYHALEEGILEAFDRQYDAVTSNAAEDSLFYQTQVLRFNRNLDEYTVLLTRGQERLLSVTVKKQDSETQPYRVTEWIYGDYME